MTQFSEDQLVEQTVIKLIKELWGDPSCHINAYSDDVDMTLGRDNRSEVVLTKHLRPALEKLNPNAPKEGIEKAISELTRSRAHLGSLVEANKEIHSLITGGYNYELTTESGTVESHHLRYFDFDNPNNNHYLCVSQLWISGEMHTRRPDVVIYVNGIPLILMELKGSHRSLVDSYHDNIRDYKDTIPQLFWYNLGIILSNGIETKFGSLTSPYEFFNEWKKVENEKEESKTDLRTAIFGLCDQSRIIDILDNFILFDSSAGKVKKIVPRYFQYYGVNRAYEQVIKRKELEGKLGVFWHTQGSGKSFSMVYLSQKVLRHISGSFTFIIVTDRTQLDGQAYSNFANVGAVYEKEVRAGSIDSLKKLLIEDHRQIFTTIQKFQDVDSTISARDNIIVMTDEAHRSQYDTFASNMRRALPNASFIGFTGTPLIEGEEQKTRETFGDYVSIYNFGQSIKDGATVPLFYENRVPVLKNVNADLENQIGAVMDRYDLDEDEESKLEQEFSTFYQLLTREDRLNTVARDIVTHFIGRGYQGKAMVVSVDKKTTIRLYVKVKQEWDKYLAKLRLDHAKTSDEYQRGKIESLITQFENLDMAVVLSAGDNQNEIDDLAEFNIDVKPIRERLIKEYLETKFKDENSNLRLVFVCAMWMTGFDVPNLSTLYLDKPLKNHTLMQTIARANRIAPGKANGIIVDYIGVFKNIEKALAIYASSAKDQDKIIRSKDELVSQLAESLDDLEEYLVSKHQIDIEILLSSPSEQKILLIEKYANEIVANPTSKKHFLEMASNLQSSYLSVLPDPSADDYCEPCAAIRTIAGRVRATSGDARDLSTVKKELETLLDRSIQTSEYIISPNKKIKDLSTLDADKLAAFFESLENKNLQIEEITSELVQKIEKLIRKNKKRQEFMDRLNMLLNSYNNGAHDIDQLFEQLVELAKSLDYEEQRAERENLSEEELAIFDLLIKDHMTSEEKDQAKKVVRELLAKLKDHKFILDWKKKEAGKSGVRNTITESLYAYIPDGNSKVADRSIYQQQIYDYVYEHFDDNSRYSSH